MVHARYKDVLLLTQTEAEGHYESPKIVHGQAGWGVITQNPVDPTLVWEEGKKNHNVIKILD
jgi:hypothetical protein